MTVIVALVCNTYSTMQVLGYVERGEIHAHIVTSVKRIVQAAELPHLSLKLALRIGSWVEHSV